MTSLEARIAALEGPRGARRGLPYIVPDDAPQSDLGRLTRSRGRGRSKSRRVGYRKPSVKSRLHKRPEKGRQNDERGDYIAARYIWRVSAMRQSSRCRRAAPDGRSARLRAILLTSAVTSAARKTKGLASPNLLTTVVIGAGEESRTPDLRITNAARIGFARIHQC